jgi:hypothetical protein
VTGYTPVATYTATTSGNKEYIPTLSDDKKTLNLTFQIDTTPVSYLAQGEQVEIKFNNLKSTDNKLVTSTHKVTVLYTTLPTLAKVEQSGKNF